jgi:hypothetical protein
MGRHYTAKRKPRAAPAGGPGCTCIWPPCPPPSPSASTPPSPRSPPVGRPRRPAQPLPRLPGGLEASGCVPRARAGRPATPPCGTATPCSPRCRSTSRPTPTANTCSTGPGPTPTSATGWTTTPSGWPPCPSRRCPGSASSAATRPAGACCSPRCARSGALRRLVPPLLFPDRDEAGWLQAAGLEPPRRAVPLAQRRLPGFRRLPRPPHPAKRKKIRQERRKVAEAGIAFRILRGARSADDWAFFHACYARTYAEHRSTPYLSRAFFADHAARPGRLRADDRRARRPAGRRELLPARRRPLRPLLGRRRIHPLPALRSLLLPGHRLRHRRRPRRFEGGAQGEHKLSRGLEPVRTTSAHWIADPRFRDAVAASWPRSGAAWRPTWTSCRSECLSGTRAEPLPPRQAPPYANPGAGAKGLPKTPGKMGWIGKTPTAGNICNPQMPQSRERQIPTARSQAQMPDRR